MTSDDQKTFMSQTFTLQARIMHPNLLTAKAKKDKKRATFDAMVVWPKNSNQQEMAKINHFLQHASNLVHPGINPAAILMPVKDFSTYIRQNGSANPDYTKDCFWVNASTGFAPVVCKPGMLPNTFINLGPNDEAEIWSGRNAVVNISFYAGIPKPGDQNQRRSFGCNIHAVMLMDGGDKVAGDGGGSNVDVNQVFGQFAGMSGGFGQNPAQTQAPQQNFQQPPQQQAPQQNFQQAPQQNYQQAPAQGNGQNGMNQNGSPMTYPSNPPQGLPPIPQQGNQGNPFGAPNQAPQQQPQWAQPGPGQGQQQQQHAQPNNFPALPNGNGWNGGNNTY